MLSAGKRWLVHASQPHLPIHALFSVPSVLAYNMREAPCPLFVTCFKKRHLSYTIGNSTI